MLSRGRADSVSSTYLFQEYFWSTSGAHFSCSLFISAEGSFVNLAFLGGIAIGSGAVSSELEGSAGLDTTLVRDRLYREIRTHSCTYVRT